MGFSLTGETVLKVLLGGWVAGFMILLLYFCFPYFAYYRYLLHRWASDPTQVEKSGLSLTNWLEFEWKRKQADPAMEYLRCTAWRRMWYAAAWLMLLLVIMAVGFVLIMTDHYS